MTLAESIKTQRLYLLVMLMLVAVLYSGVVPGMVAQWWSDDNYSHAFFVPVVAGWFLYERRHLLMRAQASPWTPGLVVIVLALLQLALGFLASEYFTMRTSIVTLISGIVLSFFGRRVFRLALLPIAYLLLMAPLPYILYDAVAFPLKLFVTAVSVEALKFIGIVVLREGNIIIFPSITLEVADACSGLRSLVSLIALAIAYAYYQKTTRARRLVIIASAIPIAIFTNAMRVIVTGILAQHWGAAAAEGFFHEFAGLMVFALATAMLVGVGTLLNAGEPG